VSTIDRLTSVEEQSNEYAHSKLKYLNNALLPFVYENTGDLAPSMFVVS
jgi:type I restriction enzyme R subunit